MKNVPGNGGGITNYTRARSHKGATGLIFQGLRICKQFLVLAAVVVVVLVVVV